MHRSHMIHDVHTGYYYVHTKFILVVLRAHLLFTIRTVHRTQLLFPVLYFAFLLRILEVLDLKRNLVTS